MSFERDASIPFSPEKGAKQLRRKAGIKEWTGLAVLALPTILLGLDVTILYLALPALAMDLQPSSTQALWIMDAYGFMIAGFLVTMGTLGDRIGRRRLLMIGAVAFAGASVLAAYAPNAEMLIAARALLGIAGATLMPSTLALISNMFSDVRQRALAIGIWATMFALGMAMGPVVGGLLLELFWWGAGFLIAVPIVLILLVAAPLLLPEYKTAQVARLDLVSVLLSLMTILPFIYGIKEFAKLGSTPLGFLMLAVGGFGAILFLRRQKRLQSPLLDLKLFASKTFTVALIILFVGLTGAAGMMLLVTQYLQLVAGYSPFIAGLWMGPPALMMVVAGVFAPLIARRIRPAHVVAVALLLASIGCGLLALVNGHLMQVHQVIIGFSLVYLGVGTIAALGTELVVGSAPAEKAGSASAMSEMVQELGVAMGVALLGSLATLMYRLQINRLNSEVMTDDVSIAIVDSLWATVAIAERLPVGVLKEAQFAFIQGMNMAATVSGVIIFTLAFLAAVNLRHVEVTEKSEH